MSSDNPLACSLDSCSFVATGGAGISAHERAHVNRGEAKWDSTGRKLISNTELVISNTESVQLPIDVDQLSPQQTQALRERLGMSNVADHSCSASRAVDRLKDALVVMTVMETLEDVPADELILMLSQMRNMPRLPQRAR